MTEEYREYLVVAAQAWLDQEIDLWIIVITKICNEWHRNLRSDLIKIMCHRPPEDLLIQRWMAQSNPQMEDAWILCMFLHGGNPNSETMRAIQTGWDLLPRQKSTRQMILDLFACFSQSGNSCWDPLPGIKTLCSIRKIFEPSDDDLDPEIETLQDEIRLNMVHSIQYCVIEKIQKVQDHFLSVVDWILEHHPIRCNRSSYDLVNLRYQNNNKITAQYLSDHTRNHASELQLWTDLDTSFQHRVAASQFYYPDLKSSALLVRVVRIRGVYLYMLDNGYRFPVIGDLAEFRTCQGSSNLDGAVTLTVAYGPEFEHEIEVSCPQLIQRAVEANLSRAKSGYN